jgi:hypothetical protein
MHDRMSDALTTYAKYATDAEKASIAAMTSRMGYHAIRQERVRRGA